MRNIIASILIVFVSVFGFTQESRLFSELAKSFKNNDSKAISMHFSESLDLVIESTDGTFGQKQASVILQEFFSKNSIKSFNINHKGSSNEKTQYTIAEMKSEHKKWSVYILINTQNKITQLQIEEE
jgi:hypothetical protein